MMAFFHLLSIFTITDLKRGKTGVRVVVNCLEALVINTIAGKLIFLEMLGCCCIRYFTGKGDNEGLLCDRRAEMAQLQSPPAQAQLMGNGLWFRGRRVRRKGH